MKFETNAHALNNVSPNRQDPKHIPITSTDLLMLRREMFAIYYERDKEPTGRANTKKTGKGKATKNSKKFC